MTSFRRVLTSVLALILLGGAVAHADELASTLKRRVEEVLAGARPMAEVRLEVVWGQAGRHELVVLGSGVGIWNLDTQFKVGESELRAALELLVKGGYFEMEERPKPKKTPEPQPHGPKLLRAVILRVGDAERAVTQTDRVLTLAALEKLVGELFAVFEKAAGQGVRASSLDDGLAKVASGELAPEALRVVLNQPPEPPTATSAGLDGLVITVKEGVMTRVTQPVGGGALREAKQALSGEQVRALAVTARDARIDAMPTNLYRPRYVDVQVAVLNQRKQMQARKFAGMDPEKHRAEQEALERFLTTVLAAEEAVPGAKK